MIMLIDVICKIKRLCLLRVQVWISINLLDFFDENSYQHIFLFAI